MKEGLIYKDKNNHKIIYDKIVGNSDDAIVFLGGLWSDRKATKANFLKQYSLNKNHSFISFDYLGHGDSDLELIDCGISNWLENSLEIIENLVKGRAILIGSSLGGWLALNVVKKIPDKIKALITIAAAPDFTEELMWNKFSDDVKHLINSTGVYNLSYENFDEVHPITQKLILSGRDNLILSDLSNLKINFPVRIFHGKKDSEVPYQYSQKIAQEISADDVEISLIEDGDHSLSREQDLQLLAKVLEDLL